MSTQKRSSVIDSSGEWAPAQAILGLTDIDELPPQQNETSQPELSKDAEGGVAPSSQSGSTVVPPHSQQPSRIPVHQPNGSPQVGPAYPPPPSTLPSRPAGRAWGEPPLTHQLPIERQPSQLYTSPAPYFTNTPTHRMATGPATQPYNSRSHFPPGPPPQRRENPVSQAIPPASGTNDAYPYLGGSTSQPYQPIYAEPSTVEQPSNPQPYHTPSSRPYMTGGMAPMRAPGSRNAAGFVANNPFHGSNNQTRPDDPDTPPSYDYISVEDDRRQPIWQPNNYTTPYPYFSSQQPPPQQAGPVPSDSGYQEAYPPVPQSSLYIPPVQNHSVNPVVPPEPPTTYPPSAMSSPSIENTIPLEPPEPPQRPPSPPTAESFPWRYTPVPSPWHRVSEHTPYYEPVMYTAPSLWSRIRNYLLPSFKRNGRLQAQPVLSESWETEEPDLGKATVDFMVNTAPRQVYLLMLLYLPSLYFSRVARIFEDADLSLPEIKKMALQTATEGKSIHVAAYMELEATAVPPEYQHLKATWEGFIDSVMREWKTFNIISVLLLTAILTILQIQSAAEDPVTRYTALFSLMFALISLLYGCMYIIRFGTMRKTYKAAEWALEAKRTKTVIWWNVWVLLAMPAIWLTWSLILYLICIMSFVWRTSPLQDSTPPEPSNGGVVATRIIITIVLAIGLIYGCLIASTFRRYGEEMDKAWKNRIDGWLQEKAVGSVPIYYPPYAGPGLSHPPPSWTYPNPTSAADHMTFHYGGSEYPLRTDPNKTPDQSQSPASTVEPEATRTNTLYNQTSTQYARSNLRKAPFVAPPSPDLPPIPGSPVTVASDSSRKDDNGGLGLTLEDRVDNGNSGHVHFRSPILSVQNNTSFTNSNSEEHPETRPSPQIRDTRPMSDS